MADRRLHWVLAAAILMVFVSGCYVDYSGPAEFEFDGTIEHNGTAFVMQGDIYLTAGERSQDTYRNVSLELYERDGDLISRHRVGTIRDPSAGRSVAVHSDQVPAYVVVNGSSIWDGDEGVLYYVRDAQSTGGYSEHVTDRRCEVPVHAPC